jgi:hypothetical protein
MQIDTVSCYVSTMSSKKKFVLANIEVAHMSHESRSE